MQSQYTIADLVDAHASSIGSHVAVTDGSVSRTYLDVQEKSDVIAAWLVEKGVQIGSPVVVELGNRVEFLEVYIGIAKSGCIIVPMSMMLNRATRQKIVDKVDPAAFVYRNEQDEVYFQVQGVDTSLERMVVNHAVSLPDVSADMACSIIFSSGTTGTPKGIVHTHLARMVYAIGFASEYGIPPQSGTVVSTPIYTNGSWMLFLPTLYSGGTLRLVSKFSAEQFETAVTDIGARQAFLVPTQIHDLLDASQKRPLKLESLEVIISAGSRLKPSYKHDINAKFGAHLYENYGNTEGVGTILRPSDLVDKAETVGRPITGGEVLAISETGKVCLPGVPGEIVGRSPYMSEGYFKDPEKTEELSWFSRRGKRYYRTGDLGVIDDDGYLSILGRTAEMIISGGINVYPKDIEDVLANHPDIYEVAVVGKPHERWGETPVAFVTLMGDIDEEELFRTVNEMLNKHQRLSALVVIDELPKNAMGKVQKNLLKEKLM